LAAVTIFEDLVATLGTEATGCPSITRYPREAKFATSNPEVIFAEPIREHDNYSQTILLAFDEQPFASVRQLARLTHLPRTALHRRLPQLLGFSVRHLSWVPHRLSDAQKSNRVDLSRALRSVLRTQQPNTGITSWSLMSRGFI
jgi:hypothetical protein